jgi:hypothetical protein
MAAQQRSLEQELLREEGVLLGADVATASRSELAPASTSPILSRRICV